MHGVMQCKLATHEQLVYYGVTLIPATVCCKVGDGTAGSACVQFISKDPYLEQLTKVRFSVSVPGITVSVE